MGVRKNAMILICKILALSSSDLINDIVNSPADASRDSSALKVTARVCDVENGDGDLAVTPNRLDTARPAPVILEDASKAACSAPRDGRLFATPDSRDRLNNGERMRSRSRKCGLVSCIG